MSVLVPGLVPALVRVIVLLVLVHGTGTGTGSREREKVERAVKTVKVAVSMG